MFNNLSQQEKLHKLERVQKTALRTITLMPDKIRRLINAESIEDGELTPDGEGMIYKVGGIIDLAIHPFDEQVILTDASGNNSPLVIEFGPEDDWDRDKVFAVVGYAELAKRDGKGQTGNDWVTELTAATSA